MIGKKAAMGFFSFMNKVFTGESADEQALDAARKRHGIVVTENKKIKAKKALKEGERYPGEYEVWDEVDKYRWGSFIGGWAAKKVHPIGEDKVKRDLAKLEKQRQQEAERKKGED